jgi:hypothetical protein
MIRARLFALEGAQTPVAVATFDGGSVSIECDDPTLRLRLTTVLNLPFEMADTLEEAGRELAPGSEEHFRAVLNQPGHLRLRAEFEDA